jgi:predicted small secreted protein
MDTLRFQTWKWVQVMLLGSALALLAAGISGCNTSKGFGEDLESVGKDIRDEAEDAK